MSANEQIDDDESVDKLTARGEWKHYNDNDGMDRAYGPLWCVASDSYHNPNDYKYDSAFQCTIYNGDEGDALLIAAAQEMYEALDEMVDAFNVNVEQLLGYELAAIAKASAALAKARGETA